MHAFRPLALLVLLSTVALAGLQCSSGEPSPATGLSIQINGLAATSDGNVTVTGNGVTRFVTRSTVLTNLFPGEYTVTAQQVLTAQAVLAPTPATQTATVNPEQTPTVTVSYNQLRPVAPLQLQAVPGLTALDEPIFLASPPNDNTRLFIAERVGRIRVFQNNVLLGTSFLDITANTNKVGERGLLSFAFHPQFATNNWIFVHSTDVNGNIVVDRYTAAGNIAALPPTRVIAIQHNQFDNHNGGTIAFGPDTFLWISTGDGGGGGDPFFNGQNQSTLLAKMLRLDVAALPYVVPFTNPFGNEVWALGLRNPFRWSFDRATNQVYIADVGQDRFEEVNVAPTTQAGVNYGWSITEGDACFNPPGNSCNPSGQTLPVLEYDHSVGCAIIGGYVYRGTAMPDLVGHYFYSDNCTGFLRSFRLVNGIAIERIDWNITSAQVRSFGEDANHELYLLAGSSVFRITQ